MCSGMARVGPGGTVCVFAPKEGMRHPLQIEPLDFLQVEPVGVQIELDT